MRGRTNKRYRNSTGDGRFARVIPIKAGSEVVDRFPLNSKSKKSRRKVNRRVNTRQSSVNTAPDWTRTLFHAGLLFIFTVMVLTPVKWELIPSIKSFFAPETITLYASTSAPDTSSVDLDSADEVKSGVTPTPTVAQNEEMRQLIKEVFGDHADKAFKLLECENRGLDPEAVNTAGNTPAGSRDIGIFQINEYWQGVNAKFLFDPELNVRIAWKIYEDSGYSFKMWTCSKKVGLN